MFISFLFVITLLYLPTRFSTRRFSIISIIMQLSIFIRRQQSALFFGTTYLKGNYSFGGKCLELSTKKSLMRSVAFPRIFRCLVGTSGLEPPTSRLSGVCSNRLSYVPVLRYLLLRLAVVSSPFPSGVFYYVWWR